MKIRRWLIKRIRIKNGHPKVISFEFIFDPTIFLFGFSYFIDNCSEAKSGWLTLNFGPFYVQFYAEY